MFGAALSDDTHRITRRLHRIEPGGTGQPVQRLLCLPAIGVTTTFRYQTFSWSP